MSYCGRCNDSRPVMVAAALTWPAPCHRGHSNGLDRLNDDDDNDNDDHCGRVWIGSRRMTRNGGNTHPQPAKINAIYVRNAEGPKFGITTVWGFFPAPTITMH